MKTKIAFPSVIAHMAVAMMFIFSSNHVMSQEVPQTRGIGLYPGDPNEYFAPYTYFYPSEDSTFFPNVARHRAAWASSTRDYNHTAHLVTDGIIGDDEPSLLAVTTPAGILPRREAEWTIDGGPFSRNILMGSSTWLQYDWSGACRVEAAKIRLQGLVAYDEGVAKQGYTIRIQTSDNGEQWQTVGERVGAGLPGSPSHYKLHSDPNKQEAQDLLPARMLDELIALQLPVQTQHVRLLFEMEGAAHWDIHEVQFLDSDHNTLDVLPSKYFSSMWISEGSGLQWLYVDIGYSLPIHQILLDWYQAPRSGIIEVSDDAMSWQRVADLPNNIVTGRSTISIDDEDLWARYVRITMNEAGPAGYYALREMQVLSDVVLDIMPRREAGLRNGRFYLSGWNWLVQRASEVEASGEELSSPHDVRTDEDLISDWLPATVPGTVLTSYVNLGSVPDPNYADNVDQISESFFRSNFWYMDHFDVPREMLGTQQWLNFDGINWKANVFLNGQRLGTIEGAFQRGCFNVTGLLRKEGNHLAVEIICNDHFAAIKEKDANTTQFNGGLLGADNPTFHASVGWDWITTVRGREAGIWNEVYLTTSGMVTVSDPYVQTQLSPDGSSVSITPSVFVRNHDTRSVSGLLSGYIGDVRFEQEITLPAQAEREVRFQPSQFPQLTGSDFHLWWPNGYGEPYLYDAGFTFTPKDGQSSSIDYKAGLREMRYTGLRDSLQIFINGRRFIPLGGNWGFDEHNLLYRSREYDIAVGYHRDMNFTMIRNWVGQVGDEAFYEACDRHGIMIWQDFWLANPADGPDPYDDVMFLRNAQDYVRRMRSHASIGLFCGRNEGFPPEAIDRKLREYVHTLTPGMEYISHSSSEGVSGGGPYWALTMPDYFSRQSGKIHSERGMPNVMNIESLRRTLSPASLWPQNVEWGQHDYTLQGAQRAAIFNQFVEKGFGEARDAEQFTRWAQLINYNGYRGMFESTSRSRAGLLLWMSHPCWPSMVWQTYDYYFDPTAAYFGCKKACEPLHIQYNALTDSIEVVNHSAGTHPALTAIATVFDLNGKRVSQQKMQISSTEDSTHPIIHRSQLATHDPQRSAVSFLRLQLLEKGEVISENLYIMSSEEGNYSALATLPQPEVEQRVTLSNTGVTQQADVTLRNKGRSPAVFLRLNLKGADGEQILPVIYSDNYITLMPGESKTIHVTWKLQDARSQQALFEVTGLY
ncbi:MAG: discoidin domain-containing protein [Bacteroidales bacterium]|nr:discoidin domain-containing protein [Bacteroidales bacterium]